MTAEEKAVRKKRAEINATTRWLPDSAFTTYFGKPPFHAYGKGNTNPPNFSQKLMTHNVNAATGTYTQHGEAIEAETTKAEYAQVYDSALLAALDKNKGMRVPKIPRKNITQVVQQPAEATEPILPKPYEAQR